MATESSAPDGLSPRRIAAAPSARRITINPLTRLEGHGRIEVLLDEAGEVDHAYLQVPELRGFEAFCVGRPAEDMPQITSRICGVCPTAHHLAATKALDALYGVTPPLPARLIRELIHHAFIVEDHALHLYLLGGPDFIVGPDAPAKERNLFGVIERVGLATAQRVIAMRRRLRELIAYFGGKAIHPVFGLPGGVSRPLAPDALAGFRTLAADAVDFAEFTLGVFNDVVLRHAAYVDLIRSDAYTHRTCYMGLVDAQNRLSLYDGDIRVVDPEGREFAKFPAAEYREFIAERAEPWSYAKFCYLKSPGWHGFKDGPGTSLYAVAPLARLNVADTIGTPRAQLARDDYFARLGGRPVHHTLANHWARAIEMLFAAERMVELLADDRITAPDVRTLPSGTPGHGIGVVEAPRGTLIHDYETDPRGVITRANLIVATQNNAARIALSVEAAARALIHRGTVSAGLLNRIEMAFRAYDPCLGCATHSLSGQPALAVSIYDPQRNLIRQLTPP